MTDATPTPPTPPEQPVTPPAAPAAPAYAPAPAAGPKQTLSLVGFIVGIASWVFSWVPVLGLLAGIAAIVISVLARTREPGAPKWMWIVGLILGILAALGGLIYLVFFIFLGIVASTSYTY